MKDRAINIVTGIFLPSYSGMMADVNLNPGLALLLRVETLPNSSVSETSAKRTKYIYIDVYIDIFCRLHGGFTT